MAFTTNHGAGSEAVPLLPVAVGKSTATCGADLISSFDADAPNATETVFLTVPEPSIEDLERRRIKLGTDLDAAVRRELAKIVKSPFGD